MSAGFRWTVDSQPRVLVLNKPMAFEPAPAHRKNRWAVDSLDYSAREVISIASGRMEVEATIKFEKNAQGLVDMLRDAADGNVVTYYPDLSNGTGYALWLVSESTELAPQAGNWSLGNYEVRTRWRDASASGTSIAPLFERLLFRLDAGHFPLGYSFTRSGSVGPYIDSDGVLKSAAANIARIEWVDLDGDGTRETPGLLLEAARTNLCLQSEDLATTWSNVRSSDSTNQTTAPDGAATADVLIEDSSSTTTHYIAQNVTKAASSLDYTFSVFVKAKERGGVRLWVGDGTLANAVVLDVSDITGTIPTPTASGSGWTARGAGGEYVGDGWYRIHVRVTSDTGTTIRCAIALHNGTSANYTGDGSSGLYVWGAQLEQAAGMSSYIPTTTTSATRNADTFYAPFSADPQQMTVYLKARLAGSAVIGSNGARLLHIGGSGSTAPRFELFFSTAGTVVVLHETASGSVSQSAATGVVPGDVLEVRGVLNADGSVTGGYAVNNANESALGSSSALELATAWNDTRLYLNQSSTVRGAANFLSTKIAAGTKTMAEMRAL